MDPAQRAMQAESDEVLYDVADHIDWRSRPPSA
jgi:hypothetical protein